MRNRPQIYQVLFITYELMQLFIGTVAIKLMQGFPTVYFFVGVGWAVAKKLEGLSVKTCRQLRQIGLAILQKEFGPKNGQSLFNYCRGIDNREIKIERERKSVSAEINYGIRFKEVSSYFYT